MSNDWSETDWNGTTLVHDWRNYIHEDLREIWYTFTSEQKEAIRRNADWLAGKEEWD